MSKAISVSTGPIFTIFSPNEKYLREFCWTGPVFPIPQGTLPWQPILCRKQYTNHVQFLQFLHHMKAFWGADDRSEIFFNISRDVAMATNFMSYRTCSLGTEVSQDLLDRFSQSLHHMVGIELQMKDTSFFRYLKGPCHGNQFSGKNGAKLPPPCTYRSVNPKGNRISPCKYMHL